MNAFVPVTTSLPVVTTTFPAPVAAVAEIATVHARCVASATDILLAVTPVVAKLTVVVPLAKCVFAPTIVTIIESFCVPLAGFMLEKVGVPATTVY